MDNIYEFCNLFHNSTGIPVQYFESGTMKLHLPSASMLPRLAEKYITDLSKSTKQIAYVLACNFCFYGMVQKQESRQRVFIGPVATSKPPEDIIKALADGIQMTKDEEDTLVGEFYDLVPIVPIQRFFHTLTLFYYEMYHSIVDIYQIISSEKERLSLSVTKNQISNTITAKEEQKFHNTYNFEQHYLHYIETGNIQGLQAFLLTPFDIKPGIISNDNIRQYKNLFIAAATTATRAAIRGGVDIEQAYQLSDSYILQMEAMSDISDIAILIYVMFADFTKHVEQAKLPSGISGDIYNAIQFIAANTNQYISVDDVALHVGKSRSHISRKFKEQVGCNLSTYILDQKLEEAKSLLAFTKKSICEISNYLCFSSQGYFQSVFKKKYRITPNEYRKQNYK